MKKIILFFLILNITSTYISSAEKIDADTTCPELMELIEKNNEQYEQKCTEISNQHKKTNQDILAKYENDSEVLQHVAKTKGILFNLDGVHLISEHDISSLNGATQAFTLLNESIRQIHEQDQENLQKNLELIKKWTEIQKNKKK